MCKEAFLISTLLETLRNHAALGQSVSIEANLGNLKTLGRASVLPTPRCLSRCLLRSSQLLFLNSHIGIVEGAAWAGVPVLSKLCTMHQMREVTFNFGAGTSAPP